VTQRVGALDESFLGRGHALGASRLLFEIGEHGAGLGSRMLIALEREAVALGLGTVRLETNIALTEAQAMYRGHGYEEIAPFSGDPYADLGFERELEALAT
jgi:GNAT superfamily N-acetyltransferase